MSNKENIVDSNSGDYNSGQYNSGQYNSGDRNSGHCNSGDRNSGDYNSGKRNSGQYNSGQYNSGDSNSGKRNSEYCNSGNRNSGNHNSGDCNSGDYNSGYCNSGNHNSGYCNSGDCNSGDYNSGYHNSGDCNSGHFNTNKPPMRMFNNIIKNQDTIIIPHIDLGLCQWVRHSDMTIEQKETYPESKIIGGILISYTYKEAWSNAWSIASQSLRQSFLDLPNFDPSIFEKITGINIETCDQVEVVANGKTVVISKESAKALGLLGEEK